VRYVNIPEHKILVKELDNRLKLNVETSGFKLILSRLGFQRFFLDVDYKDYRNNRYVLTEDLRRKFSDNLPPDIKLRSISPDTLFLFFDEKGTKKIPVHLVSQLEFEKQYGLKDSIIISPDSVEITGPRMIIDTIRSWPTIPLKIRGLKTSRDANIDLAPASGSLTISPKNVHYKVEVEEYTEQSIEVEVKRLNVPQDVEITTYPKKITVTFQVPLSSYQTVGEDAFEAVADFSQIDIKTQQKIFVELTKMPGFVKNVTITPRSVEYIIYN
jgi:YbbR domain-containing protein